MSLDLRKRVIERLKTNPETQYKARDLALWIFESYPKECAEKRANSANPSLQEDNALIQQIAAEIGANRPNWQSKFPSLKTTEGRPRRYYWSEKNADQAVAQAEIEGINAKADSPPHANVLTIEAVALKTTEYDLYPLLKQYLMKALNVYAMRINEKRSSNKAGFGANKWLHPDLVGIEDLTHDWNNELKQLVGSINERRARLWSFEVKLLLNRSNVRESYFQTVSNSSWANFGYLVAATVEGDDTLKELNVLSAAHGIGLIQLDIDEPTESQILIPARERTDLDWSTSNRLAKENPDFIDFLERVTRFHQTGKIIPSEWKS